MFELAWFEPVYLLVPLTMATDVAKCVVNSLTFLANQVPLA